MGWGVGLKLDTFTKCSLAQEGRRSSLNYEKDWGKLDAGETHEGKFREGREETERGGGRKDRQGEVILKF